MDPGLPPARPGTMVNGVIPGRLHIDQALPADQALSRGRALWEARRTGDAAGCTLYAAPLRGEGVVLGAYQHAPDALNARALGELPVFRRAAGGIAVQAGEGVLYVALGLRDASSLMKCPPGRILNRNVRGLLQGVRGLGVPAHYFGRDFVSFAGEPGAYVAWSEADDGGVLLELFVGLERTFALPPALSGYPEPDEPPFRGKPPTCLRAAGARADASAALEGIAAGYARLHGVEFDAEAPSAEELSRAATLAGESRVAPDLHAAPSALRRSRPRPEAIGFVCAGVALDADGRIDEVALQGDFMQHADCAPRLQGALRGAEPDPTRVGAALDAVYAARPGLIEGVRSLTSLREVILEAARTAEAPA